jgi:hypothetical protein
MGLMASTANLQIAIIVADADGLEHYVRRFSAPNLTFHAFASLQSLMMNGSKNLAFSGVVLDMKTVLRASPVEKNFLRDVLEGQLPIGKFNRPTGQGGLDAVAEKILQTQWDSFLAECQSFNPRGVRTYPRRNCILKVQLCPDGEWDTEKSFRTFTADISSGGCFIASTDTWGKSTMVSFLLGDSKDPIRAKVAWLRPWGSSIWQMPGLGVEFESLTATQRLAIAKVIDIVTKGGN